MKRTLFFLLSLVLALGLMQPRSVNAQENSPLAAATWTSKIAYMNPGSDSADILITYYDETGNALPETNSIEDVPANGSGVVWVGATVRGSAVISSSSQVLAVYEQLPPLAEADQNYGRPLYTAMDASFAGGTIYLPNFYYEFVEKAGFFSTKTLKFTSTVGVQNITKAEVSVTISHNGTELTTKSIPAQSSFIFTGSDLGLGTGFSDALVVTGPANSIVAAVETEQQNDELNIGRRAFAYEGLSSNQSAQKIILPRMSCSAYAKAPTTLFYIQATTDADAVVSVNFYTSAGIKVTPKYPLSFTDLAVSAGQRIVVDPCTDVRLRGKKGSAEIIATSGSIVAAGIEKDVYGLGTAFTGQTLPATASYRYMVPYVTWGKRSVDPRTYLYIQNIGTAVAATQIFYYNQDGTLATLKNPSKYYATHRIYAIKSNNPYVARATRLSLFNGSAVIISNQPLVVTVRVQRTVSKLPGTRKLAEDYQGIYWP